MRNCVDFLVYVAGPPSPRLQLPPVGELLLVVLACWSLYRIATRSQRGIFIAADYVMALAVCAAVPMLWQTRAFICPIVRAGDRGYGRDQFLGGGVPINTACR